MQNPGFPSNHVAAGQVDPPAVRITMVCSLFACCLSASEAFLFLSGAVCWVFSNAYTKEEHLLVFFVASDRRRAGVTRRRRPLVDCATPPRHLSKKRKSKSLALNNVPAWLKIYICVHGELFTGCAARFAVKISQEYCASQQWLITQRTREDCDRMLLKIEGLAGVGENNDFLEIDLTSWQQTYSWIRNVEPSWGRFALLEAKQSWAHLGTAWSACFLQQIRSLPPNALKIFPL